MMNETLKRGHIPNAQTGGEEALIGVHDHFEPGDFVTVLGQPFEELQFQKWKNDRIPNHKEPFNCIALEFGISLVNVSCTLKYTFFCEIPLHF